MGERAGAAEDEAGRAINSWVAWRRRPFTDPIDALVLLFASFFDGRSRSRDSGSWAAGPRPRGLRRPRRPGSGGGRPVRAPEGGGDLGSPPPRDPPPIFLARRMVFKRPPGDAAAGRCRRCGCRSRRVCGFGGCGRQSCSFRMCAPSNGEGFSSMTALTLLTLSRVCHRCLIRGGLHGTLGSIGGLCCFVPRYWTSLTYP